MCEGGGKPGPSAESCFQYVTIPELFMLSYYFLLLPKPNSLFDTVIPGNESSTLCRTQSTERSEWLLSDNSRDALPLSWGEDG